MTDDLDIRRRRAIYRATYRGTKEMDWLLGRFADAHVPKMDTEALTRFEQVLALPDPDLQGWLMDGGREPTGDLAPDLAAIRAFHGVNAPAERQI